MEVEAPPEPRPGGPEAAAAPEDEDARPDDPEEPPAPLLLRSSRSEMTENGSLQMRPSARRKAKWEGPTSICLRPEPRSASEVEKAAEDAEEAEANAAADEEVPGAGEEAEGDAECECWCKWEVDGVEEPLEQVKR